MFRCPARRFSLITRSLFFGVRTPPPPRVPRRRSRQRWSSRRPSASSRSSRWPRVTTPTAISTLTRRPARGISTASVQTSPSTCPSLRQPVALLLGFSRHRRHWLRTSRPPPSLRHRSARRHRLRWRPLLHRRCTRQRRLRRLQLLPPPPLPRRRRLSPQRRHSSRPSPPLSR